VRPKYETVVCTAVIGAWLAVAAILMRGSTLDPFQGPYRLKVGEPTEGASLPEGTIRVVAELEKQAEQSPTAKDATPAPKPRVEVFLDNEPKGTLKDGQTSLSIEGVAAGTHTLLVTSSDPGNGTVVERKEIHFTAIPPAPH
jgi:hypothetical protein